MQRALFGSIHFFSIATDVTGVIQQMNAGAQRLLGFDTADVLQPRNMADLIDPDALAARVATVQQAFGIPLSSGFEALIYPASRGAEDLYALTCIHINGNRHAVTVSVTALRDEAGGALLGYLFHGHAMTTQTGPSADEADDVAERVQAQERQRISDLALQTISQGVMISGPDGCLQSVNAAFLAITGYCEAEVLGRTCAFLQGPGTDAVTRDAIRHAVLKATEFNGDILNYRKDGSTFWNELSISPVFNTSGQLIHFIGITRDITARKLTEERLESYWYKLEQLVAARTTELSTALIESSQVTEQLKAEMRERQTIQERLRESEAYQRVQAELRESERQLKQLNQSLESQVVLRSQELAELYDHAPCGYHSLDASGKVIQVNQTELDLMGYTRDEYLGHHITEFMPAHSRAKFTQRFEAIKQNGQIRNVEFDLIRKGGDIASFLISANLVCDAQGKFVCIRTATIDNRQSKARQQQISQLNQFLTGVVESLPFGVVVLDPQRQIVLHNSLFGTLLKYPPELLERPALDFAEVVRFGFERGDYQGESFDGALSRLTHLMQTRQPVCLERLPRNGVYLEVRGQPIGTDWTLITYADITAFKLAEQALAQARETADLANHAKSAFLSNMSHELRTPLNAVLGLTDLLADSPLNPRQRDYIEKIRLSARALRALVDDIMDLAKIEANRLQLEHAPFSLMDVLTAVMSVLGIGVGNKPIEVGLDVATDVPDALVGDALRLQQILLNLVSNAVKFTDSGEIVLSVRCRYGADAPEGAQTGLHFSVRDTGIGMSDATLGIIFDGFTQADTSTSRLHGGTGLGLTISDRLATLLGSAIEVDSRLGQGSAFCLTVPLTIGRRTAPMVAEGVPAGLRLLIVDDHPLARRLLLQSCRQLGWQAHAVDSAAAGLQELQRSTATGEDYKLMLLDWRMPGMDGLALLRQAHATPDIALPLVILMAPMAELEQAATAGAEFSLDGIVGKPLLPAELLQAVSNAVWVGVSQVCPAIAQANHRLAGMGLLVVEDNALNQEVIGNILTQAGARVVLAANGQAALDVLRLPGAHFDAVLMDIQMPGMDGYATSRCIREELGLLDLPIIAVTAHARPQDQEQSRLAGMAGHLVKPLDVDVLLKLLTQVTRQQCGGQPDASDPARGALHLDGLDFAAAMKTFGGDTARFGSILRKFLRQHAGDVAAARSHFNAGDANRAMVLVHDLRGVGSFLQARELPQLAGATESALREGLGSELPPLFDALQSAMETLEKSLQQFETVYANV